MAFPRDVKHWAVQLAQCCSCHKGTSDQTSMKHQACIVTLHQGVCHPTCRGRRRPFVRRRLGSTDIHRLPLTTRCETITKYGVYRQIRALPPVMIFSLWLTGEGSRQNAIADVLEILRASTDDIICTHEIILHGLACFGTAPEHVKTAVEFDPYHPLESKSCALVSCPQSFYDVHAHNTKDSCFLCSPNCSAALFRAATAAHTSSRCGASPSTKNPDLDETFSALVGCPQNSA